jgi:SAM-dependent methyltransferase
MTGPVWQQDEAEIAAVFNLLREEVASRPPAAEKATHSASGAAAPESVGRAQAERSWAVTADRPFLYKPGRWGRLRGLLLSPLKRVLRKLMRWYVEPALAQQREFNSSLLRALDELSERVDVVAGELVEVAGELTELSGAVEPLDRSLAEVDERLLRIERRTRRGEPPLAAPGTRATSAPPVATVPAEGPDYFAFEARMRGSAELIRERQSVYVDEFRGAGPVLDIGCGRGEFLSLLREAEVDARGIDVDGDMVARCRDEGLEVEQADVLSHLESLDDGSLGGIFCAHVLEHLAPPALFRVLELAAVKLRPSGRFVAETPNPLSLVALANFSSDLSHDKPLHPATLSFLARQAGFHQVELRFLSEPPATERLQLVPLPEGRDFEPTRKALNANVHRLNDVVFGPQDYALLAKT